MKVFKYILFSIFLLASACDDFLEEDPRSLVATDAFYNNLNEATRALYGVYHYLDPMYASLGVGLVSDATADVLSIGAGGGGTQAVVFDDFTHNASSGVLEDLYQDHYEMISSANTLIANVEGKALGDETEQNVILGEAKFLRALAYFNMVRLFGDVPLRTEPATSVEGLAISRTAADAVYEQVIQDLTEAASVLQEESAEPGRANQLAAYALLAKVYLTVHDYPAAIAALEQVLGKRSLYPDFADNFKIVNENNLVESIFEVQYGLSPENSNIIQFLTPNTVTGHGFVFSVFRAEDELINAYDENDVRKAFTFWNSEDGKDFGAYFVKKFNDGLLPGVQATDAGEINYPVLRYADVLLMYAEALNEQNGAPTPEAYAAVNQVRNRAGLENLAPGLSQENFLDAVLTERWKEFVAEGHRWFDLKRNGKLNEELSSKGFVAGKHELMPIPQAAIDANKNLEQNEGY